MEREILEILMGKYLDSEIAPSEQRLLETELDRDPQVKELFKQLQDLHEFSSEFVTAEITEPGRPVEDVFEQAWQLQSKRSFRFVGELGNHLRFAAGLAAGLIIGLSLHFALSSNTQPQDDPVSPKVLVQSTNNQAEEEKPVLPNVIAEPSNNVFRNVDWYSFTDKEGNQWLIEGLREDIVRPASYSGDL